MAGNNWIEEEGRLTRNFEFSNFKTALEFVNKVAIVAEKSQHHPDITFGWGYVHISIYTHDKAEITGKDWDLAKAIASMV